MFELFGLGQGIGALVGLCLFMALYYWGDKFLLSIMDASPLHPKVHWNEIVQNYACRLGLGHVDVYICHRFPQNIYAIASPKTHSLVIGRKVLEELENEEIKAVILATMLLLRRGDAKFNTYVSLLLAIAYAPFAWINHSHRKVLFPRLRFITNLYFHGLCYLQCRIKPTNMFQILTSELKEWFDNFGQLASALVKIGSMTTPEDSNVRSAILDNLSIDQNNKRDAVLGLMRDDIPLEKKYWSSLRDKSEHAG